MSLAAKDGADLRKLLPIVSDIAPRIDGDDPLARDGARAFARPIVDRRMAGRDHRDELRARILTAPSGRAGQLAARIRLVADEIGADVTAHQLRPDAADIGRAGAGDSAGIYIESFGDRRGEIGGNIGRRLMCGVGAIVCGAGGQRSERQNSGDQRREKKAK